MTLLRILYGYKMAMSSKKINFLLEKVIGKTGTFRVCFYCLLLVNVKLSINVPFGRKHFIVRVDLVASKVR